MIMTSRKQLLFLFALVVNGAVASHREWHAFLSQYERAYDNDAEHDARYAIFRRNLALIEAHNAEADLGMHTYRLAVNQFADLTGDEFRIRHKLKRSSASSSAPSAHRLFRLATADDDNDLPKSMDWRSKDMVTPVKDQGMCGSCWSFAATGSMEGAHALAASAADPLRRLTKKPLLSFSEQELVDCVDGGEFTCDTGGIYTEAFEFVIANGTVLESEYRYVNGMDTTKERCRLGASGYNSHPMKFFTKYVTLVSGDENALKRASSEHPGVAVAIDASSDSFQFYSSGVYHSETCSSEDLDHAVLVVGYGTDPVGGDFWLVKNSWSAAWGEHGYIRMARNRGNMCGIATYPAYILAEDAVSHGSAVYVSVM